MQLPADSAEKLLLVQRGEDYALFSLWSEVVQSAPAEGSASAMAELFCDRPLYRPGETAHVRGVLRRPVRGGLALPHSQRATLTIHKPNGEVLETRPVTLDAYGALAADVALPDGEEEVTGRYLCTLELEEGGKPVRAQLSLACEVFRRDAFEAQLSMELDPVAPRQFAVQVQARDYNGTPLAGGKVELSLSSTAELLDAAGKRPEGVQVSSYGGKDSYELTHSLVLDGEGRARYSGHFGAYEEVKILNARASVANDREDYVRLPRSWRTFSPADFTMAVDEQSHLHVQDAASEPARPLARAQEVELRLVVEEELRHELPSGIWYTETQEREVGCHRLTVPADCQQGVDLRPYWEKEDWYKEGQKRLTLLLSGRDAAGRLIRARHAVSNWRVDRGSAFSLTPEGRSLRVEYREPARHAGTLHAYIGSQGQRRHALVEVKAGQRELRIPLRPQEYGSVNLSLISCGQDAWGTFTHWEEESARCELPRPDKELQVAFTLPEGARPGQKVALAGRVLGADGQPVKAAITLFAVDAGMMSVAPYQLPELATRFYRGTAPGFWLASGGKVGEPCHPWLSALPNVWSHSDGTWYGGAPQANRRSIVPAGMNVGSFVPLELGGLFRWSMQDVVRAARPNFRWSNLLGMDDEEEGEGMVYAPAPAPVVTGAEEAPAALKTAKKSRLSAGLRSGSGELEKADAQWEETPSRANALAEEQPLRLRADFSPVALWLASVESGADGSFVAECQLPDTLTTYKVYAVALDASGSSFGEAQGEFLVNQELMLTAGTPFFMSQGDTLLLPLAVTNNRESAGAWDIALEGAGETASQHVELDGKSTTTLYFRVHAREEGSCVLRWSARGEDGGDAVEGSFPVRYPAPLLKENHRLVLAAGGAPSATAELLADYVGTATRGEVELRCSTSPLIHLSGSLDYLLGYPYGCTEQKASTLLPWILHEQLAPFCPQMARTSVAEAKSAVARNIGQILARQQEDGGLSYWSTPKGTAAQSSPWASAYAGLVLTLAQEQGFDVPADALQALRDYLGRQNWYKHGYLTQYAVARARGRQGEISRILVKALRKELQLEQSAGFERDSTDLEFLAQLQSQPGQRHEALLSWLRSKGRDYRHRSSWNSGWTLIALAEYLKLEPRVAGSGSVIINGEEHTVAAAPSTWHYRAGEGQSVKDLAPTLAAGSGTVYASVHVKAQPEQTEYPGVTEHGLQVTRVYEVKGADGQWRESNHFNVGDIVRVTLTCAKIADELQYLVLEDYLPACMEAINPNIPGQAAGLEDGGWGVWSRWIDHKEYLADRVRGFCTRWAGRDVVNMSYYARVKRAGESTAAPAEAQLMYEPQTYGLSPNVRVRSE